MVSVTDRPVRTINPVISALAAQQSASGWSDATVAKRIGISRQLWHYLRKGERQPGIETMQQIAMRFPDLADAVRLFMAPSSPKVARRILAVKPQRRGQPAIVPAPVPA
jgi:transcriptional regulator with XRE-family HTH domain